MILSPKIRLPAHSSCYIWLDFYGLVTAFNVIPITLTLIHDGGFESYNDILVRMK